MSSPKKVLSLSVNEERTCFVCGTEFGFQLFYIEPLTQMVSQDIPDSGGIITSHLLKRTNLIALVGNGKSGKFNKNQIRIWDCSIKKPVLEYTFPSNVLNVKLCKQMIIIVLQNKVLCYSFPTEELKLLFTYNTRDNFNGICEISYGFDNQWCVFPGPNKGSVQLVNLDIKRLGNSSSPCIVNAHQHEIACIALNQQGTLVATASTKGTLIRVYEIKTKRQCIELRRGADPASLYCINFSADSAYLCASSDKGTIHIFALKDTSKNKRSTLSKVGLFGNYLESQWGLANFSVPAECPCLCVFGPGSSVIAICYDGSFHKYVFTKDGNCNRESFDMFLALTDDRDFI